MGDHYWGGVVSFWGERGKVVRNYPSSGVRFDSVSICTRIPRDPFFQSLMPENRLQIFTQEKAILGKWVGKERKGKGGILNINLFMHLLCMT